MNRLFAWLLMAGLLIAVPMQVTAQDQPDEAKKEAVQNDKEQPKAEPNEPKTTEPAPEPKEEKPAAQAKPAPVAAPKTAPPDRWSMPAIYSRLESLIPIINLVLLAVVFGLLMNLRGTISQLEEKIKNSGG